jgi:FMN phosphatase YigB (HAD superfamily)
MMAIELLLKGRSSIKTLQTFRHEQERLRSEDPPFHTDPFQLQIERTAQLLNLPPNDVSAVVERWMFIQPGRWLRIFRRRRLLQAVADFRHGGGKTAVVSDYPARRKLTAMTVVDLFDAVVACGETGGPNGLKPCPHGLLLAAKQLNVSPNDCLVIGDRSTVDGEAARAAGMDFRHVNSRWMH